jgi:protoporphyrinogen oxidase
VPGITLPKKGREKPVALSRRACFHGRLLHKKVIIIGAGPAGLTAAYILAKAGVPVVVLEADPQYVGGISRTAQYKGFRFDIGGHRFFSKSQEIEDLWTEILPNDMLVRPRSSRICYNHKFFSYPLKPAEAFLKLGPVESIRCGLSYLWARLFPVKEPRNFQEWVTNKFGRRLFEIFFKTYTEKVWGMPCTEISADWAAQRIKGLSLSKAVLGALWPESTGAKGDVIKTLINTFRYPRFGPGMMWEACTQKIRELGGEVRMGQRVTGCRYEEGDWTVSVCGEDGATSEMTGEHLVSSAPIRELAASLSPKLGEPAAGAAASLKYRDFLTVVLILKERNAFSDNWIYVHDPDVSVGRIQNFKSWSPEMVPDPALACYGMEYFCFAGDSLWTTSDADLIELGKQELVRLGLGKADDFRDGCVVRQAKAYPVYDDEYAEHVRTVRDELERSFPTAHLIGRNGMHKYNNQDHSMMTAILCAKNILAGFRKYDLWEVNEDAEYHESGSALETSSTSGLRSVPQRVARS